MQSIKSSKHKSTHDFGVVVVVVVVVVAGVVVPVDGGCVVQGPLSMVKDKQKIYDSYLVCF